MSIDGYLDDGSGRRLLLSNEADLDRVDAVRAGCDAILVGAQTVRQDNPRLLVKSSARRRERIDRGLASSPLKVTVTAGGALDPDADFFTTGDGGKLVYCASAAVTSMRQRLEGAAEVVDAGQPVDLAWLGGDLHDRGVRRLLVEGGGATLTGFLQADLVDELHLAVAPVFVGESRARRLVREGPFPWNSGRRAELAQVRQIGDVALLTYALSPRYGEC
jgi:5-amino-6-(5-phosphoribosylamino)uracil reductase